MIKRIILSLQIIIKPGFIMVFERIMINSFIPFGSRNGVV